MKFFLVGYWIFLVGYWIFLVGYWIFPASLDRLLDIPCWIFLFQFLPILPGTTRINGTYGDCPSGTDEPFLYSNISILSRTIAIF